MRASAVMGGVSEISAVMSHTNARQEPVAGTEPARETPLRHLPRQAAAVQVMFYNSADITASHSKAQTVDDLHKTCPPESKTSRPQARLQAAHRSTTHTSSRTQIHANLTQIQHKSGPWANTDHGCRGWFKGLQIRLVVLFCVCSENWQPQGPGEHVARVGGQISAGAVEPRNSIGLGISLWRQA